MGMDYLPVYEGEAASQRQISISPEKVQRLGVKTEKAAFRSLARTLRALGSIQADERRIHLVTAKFEGWIQALRVQATGEAVQRGQPLLEAYSPELVEAQQDYLIARAGQQALSAASAQARATAAQLSRNALQRLRFWDIAPAQLQNLQTLGKALDTLPLLSPVSGVVLEKQAVEGMRFMPGEPLFRIADLSAVWLLVEVFEQDLEGIKLGQTVSVHINAYPSRTFAGRVSFIYPTVAPETRTAKLRIAMPNPAGLLKPGLYGSALLEVGAGEAERLAVPESAILDSGTRQVLLAQLGEGRFEPREVALGRRADGYVEVLAGVAAGESVVIRANFLIDAESNLKGALQGLSPPSPQAPALPAPHAHGGH
jgi:Cu(I)/Ag(I) efflux system membrane fusion protein